MSGASEAAAERAVVVLKRAIEAAENSNQAGENFVVAAAAAPDLVEALEGAIGALEFSRDYHSDLGNAEQAFAQDKLDAARAALAKAREGGAS